MFIVNALETDEEIIKKFLNNIIADLNITQAHYLFLYNPIYNGEIKSYDKTLYFNVNVSKNEKEFIIQYKNVKKKIYSYYHDLEKTINEKKYYDLFIKIYVQKNKYNVMKSLKSDEKDLIQKINEIIYFMSNLELKNDIPEVVDESQCEALFSFINEIIKDFIESRMNEKKIDNIFREIKKSLSKGEIIIDAVQKKLKSFCSSYLKCCILDNIYNNFIDVILPEISFHSYKEKIKILLIEKEKEK